MLTMYRLTYSFDGETIYTEVLSSEATDFAGIVEEAIVHIEKEYEPTAVLYIKGFSILMLDDKKEAANEIPSV